MGCRQRPLLQRPWLGYEHPAGWKRTPTTLPQRRGHLVQQPGHPVLLDIGDGDPVDTRCAAVAAHVLPRPLQDVSAMDLVPRRVEPSPGIGLGRPVQRTCCKARTGSMTDPEAAELAETALTGLLQDEHYAPTKQRPFPHRRLCCPL